MQRTNILRVGIIVVAVAALGASLTASRWRVAESSTAALVIPTIPNDLSAELRRCSTLGPQDAEDPRCEAVWKENRERFFGRPARPLRPGAAPANLPAGDAP